MNRYYYILFAIPNSASCFFHVYDRQEGEVIWEGATYEDAETCTEAAEEVTQAFNDKKCRHMKVTIHSRLYRRETLYEPAEYEYKACCDQCGEWMEIEDVPEEAEQHEV